MSAVSFQRCPFDFQSPTNVRETLKAIEDKSGALGPNKARNITVAAPCSKSDFLNFKHSQFTYPSLIKFFSFQLPGKILDFTFQLSLLVFELEKQ